MVYLIKISESVTNMDISNIIVGKNLNTRLIKDFPPVKGNPRNSEGSFLRVDDGSILYAYSRFTGEKNGDHCPSDIALIRSYDEGESWSEPEIIAEAKFFGVHNIMSVSGIRGLDNSIQFYFLIKEDGGKDLTEHEEEIYSTIGRTISFDGGRTFKTEKCNLIAPKRYYVMCNDRMERQKDGTLLYPCCYGSKEFSTASSVFVSKDDGKTFEIIDSEIVIPYKTSWNQGMVEPLLHLQEDGVIALYARTGYYFQYVSYSKDNLKSFSIPEPSEFSSASSPMEFIKSPNGVLYAVYNPIPGFNFKYRAKGCHGRTPLAIRKSLDDGKTWGELNIIEGDPECGYCYAAMFFTNDNQMLISYGRGGHGEDSCLAHMGILKIDLNEII